MYKRLLCCVGWLVGCALPLQLVPAYSSAMSLSVPATTALAGTIQRASVAADGSQALGPSVGASLSADGRFVAFISTATNLAAPDTNNDTDVFVADRLTHAVTRVTMASDGTQPIGTTYRFTLSADANVVAFISWAGNLVKGDTNGVPDVFVHDRVSGLTTRVSVASNGTQANDWSGVRDVALSADGRFVAFDALASNLVPGDTNGHADVFVRDRLIGTTTRVSVASDGTQSGNQSWGAAISADGRYVVFASESNVLVPGDTNECGLAINGACPDVFVHDRLTHATRRVSVATDGTQGNERSGDSGVAISADGRYVAFDSSASNLVAGDTNNTSDVFVHDLQTGQTSRVSVASDGTQSNDGSIVGAISADGEAVGFTSTASNLVSGDTNACSLDPYFDYRDGHCPDLFVHHGASGQTIRISESPDGAQVNMSALRYVVSFSANGRQVAFDSLADNLVPGDTNSTSDVFVYTAPAATIASNYTSARPGSWLAIAGEQFAPNTRISLAINGRDLGTVDSDAAGAWASLLSTDQADAGYYIVTAQAPGLAPATAFWLDTNAPLRAKVGNAQAFGVPAGVAYHNILYVPCVVTE